MSPKDEKNGCSLAKENKVRIESLETMFNRFVENDFKELKQDVRWLIKNIKSRPTWAVTVIISVLLSSCVGLAVALIRVLGG